MPSRPPTATATAAIATNTKATPQSFSTDFILPNSDRS
jgi:hypothetical protein